MQRRFADEYRALGLRAGASFAEVKAAYRRLARRYHPDMNPGDRQASERFIRITQAYQRLVEALPSRAAVPSQPTAPDAPQSPDPAAQASPREPRTRVTVTHSVETVKVDVNPALSQADQVLKQRAYEQLQSLLGSQKFPRAIALVDGLAQRLTQDSEVRQWQAITYQRWGRYLIRHGQYDKARLYLKKALRVDPHNQSLWQEINRDFQLIEHRAWQRPRASTR